MSGLVDQSADARSKTIGQNFRCRAWVNFKGTGTVAIRASGNVSSITDVGAGDYTVNYTTAMPDANYVCNINCADNNNSTVLGQAIYSASFGGTDPSTSAIRIVTPNSSSGGTDNEYVLVAIFR